MKRKFKRDSDLAAQLGQVFTRFERAVITANCNFVKDLREIEKKHGAIFILKADELADAYQDFTAAYYKGTMILRGNNTARPKGVKTCLNLTTGYFQH